MKRYTIFVRDKVAKTKKANGPQGEVTRVVIAADPVYPATFVRRVYNAIDLTSDDITQRTELWEDTAGVATDEQIFATCPRLRDQVANRVRLDGAFRLDQLATPYQPTERDTWPTQLSEAEAFLADQAAATPMLDAIAAGRGIEKAALVDLVMGNANLFRVAAGALLGQQQAMLDRIYAEQSVEKLLAIAWPA